MLSALHTIARYPLDLCDPVFEHYPAMKFGEQSAIDHFAALLTPNAEALYGDLLTSPPVRGLPSGANLVCEELRRRLEMELAPIRLTDAPGAFTSEADFIAYGDYARLDYATRRTFEPDEDAVFDGSRFQGRNVVFVNDINVTGSQMRRMTALLRKARPRAVHWLLILNVSPRVGRRFPHLESEINHFRLAENDEIVNFLRRSELTFTGKFVARLLSYGVESWEYICCSLDRPTRRTIREAILTEGMYSSDIFREKLAML